MSTEAPSVSDVIASMKAAVGATTDIELAAALGVERSAIAKWKARGAVPERHVLALPLPGGAGRFGRYINALRARLFSKPEVHYLLRAALAFLTAEDLTEERTAAGRGGGRELTVLMLAGAAQLVCIETLHKRCPTTEEEYEALISAIAGQGPDWKDRALNPEVVSQWGFPNRSERT